MPRAEGSKLINFNVTEDQRELIKQAAEFLGLDVSGFVRSLALERARLVVAENHIAGRESEAPAPQRRAPPARASSKNGAQSAVSAK